MASRVKRYFLEIKDFSKTVDLNLPENFKIILDDKDNFHLNRFFYKQIGVDHYWRDRLLWSDSEWVKYVTNKNLETHVLKKGEDLVGYDKESKREVEFGISFLRLGKKLEKGFCITVEPGIYFIPELFYQWKKENKHSNFINYDKFEKYLEPLGGGLFKGSRTTHLSKL